MAKAKKRRKKRGASATRPTAAREALGEDASAEAPAAGAGEGVVEPGGSEVDPETDAVSGAEERSARARPRRARQPRLAAHDASASRRAPGPAPAKPWWLLLAIAAIIGAVLVIRYSSSDAAGTGTEVELVVAPAPPERLRVRVVNRFPHARDAFTQGLLWHDGALYESTGLRGESTVRRVDLTSGRVLESRQLDDRLFAEGLARVGDELVQLTWTSGEAHVWTVDGFEHRRTMSYDGEGWGLCYDGEHLVMSDGGPRLTFRDPATFRVQRVVTVRAAGEPVEDLNELECVGSDVWANVWQSDRIVRIDAQSGRVTGEVDATGLLGEDDDWDTDVLNGIAWIEERGHFVITGKRWPWLYEVDFVPAEGGE